MSAAELIDQAVTPMTAEGCFASGNGKFHSDTGKNPRPLTTTSMAKIVEMMAVPQSCAKDNCKWIIPSSLLTRCKSAQLESGRFWALWGDLDGEQITPTAEVAGIVSERLSGAEVLAYSSSSATEERQKARIIVYLESHVDGVTYQRMARAFNDLLAKLGLEPDRKTESANQVLYLPNLGDFYATSSAGVHGLAPAFFAEEVAAIEVEEAAQEAADKAARVISAEALQARMAKGEKSPITAFNACYDVETMWRHYGATGRSGRLLSPHSDSGSPAITIKDGKWFSSHGSDLALGIGRAKGGACWGDAFDLFKYFEHGNDESAAVKAAGALTGVTEQNRDAWRAARLLQRQAEAAMPAKAALDTEQDASQAGVCDSQSYDANQVIPKRFALLDGADLADNAKAPTYLIDEVLEDDAHGIMGGLSMTYKSFLALRMAYSICTGEPFMGRQVYSTGPVIYVCGEGRGGISRRWKALQLKLGKVPAGSFFLYNSPLQLRDATSMQTLKECIEEVRPALVIFDTFASLAGGIEENSPSEVGNALGNVRRVCQAGGASSLIVHHFGKDATKGFRGASNFTNDVDFAFMVNRPEGDQKSRKACMVAHKMKDGEPFGPIHFKALPVALGLIDQKGQEVYSLVVESDTAPGVDVAAIIEHGKAWEKALEALRICWNVQRDRLADSRPGANPAVTWDDWRLVMTDMGVSNPRRERDSLANKDLIECLSGNEYRPKD